MNTDNKRRWSFVTSQADRAHFVGRIDTINTFVCTIGVTWVRCEPMWCDIRDVVVAGVDPEPLLRGVMQAGSEVMASAAWSDATTTEVMVHVAGAVAELYREAVAEGQRGLTATIGVNPNWASEYEGLEEKAHTHPRGLMVVWSTLGGSHRLILAVLGEDDWTESLAELDGLRELLIRWRSEHEPPVRIIMGPTYFRGQPLTGEA